MRDERLTDRAYLSIGDVLTLLKEEFADVTISKIRFLESQGLLDPERTPSGYRKFYEDDVERLRWILRQQREHFLPLKVIKDRLDDEPAEIGEATRPPPGTWSPGSSSAPAQVEPAPAPPGRSPGPLGPDHRFEPPVAGHPESPESSRQAEPAVNARQAETVVPVRPTEPAPARQAEPVSARQAETVVPVRPTEPVSARQPEPVPARQPEPVPARQVEPVSARQPEPVPAGQAEPVVPARPVQPVGPARQPEPVTGDGRTSRDDRGPTEASRSLPTGGGPAAEPARTAPVTSGMPPSSPASAPPAVPHAGSPALSAGLTGVDFNLDELAAAAGLSVEEVGQLEQYGLLAGKPMGGTVYYDEEALTVARLVAGFRAFGVEARHLRMYKLAADREAGFFQQIILPLLKQRNPQARFRAVQTLEEMSRLGQGLRTSLLRIALRNQA